MDVSIIDRTETSRVGGVKASTDKRTLRTTADKDLFTEHDRCHVIRRTHVTNSVSGSRANGRTDGYAALSAVQQPLLASPRRATVCVIANAARPECARPIYWGDAREAFPPRIDAKTVEQLNGLFEIPL